MFYKKNENTGEWYTGNEVHFPDGTKLNADNKANNEGWFWSDNEPEDYINWLKQFDI